MSNYYPWNAQALVDWLKAELANSQGLHALASRLQIPQYVLLDWLTISIPPLTLEYLQRITFYRSWTLDKTVQWLEIRPAHLKELQALSEARA